MASRRKGRVLAFQSLYSWEAGGRLLPVPEEMLNFSWLEPDKLERIDPETAGFARLIMLGTIEEIDAVDSMIRSHLENWDFSRLARVDLAILRFSVWTLICQRDMPPSIVIDEAIGIAKEYGGADSFRFVNGVLDSIRKTLEAGTGQDGSASVSAQGDPAAQDVPAAQED